MLHIGVGDHLNTGMKDDGKDSFQEEEETSSTRYKSGRRYWYPAKHANMCNFVALLEFAFDEAW